MPAPAFRLLPHVSATLLALSAFAAHGQTAAPAAPAEPATLPTINVEASADASAEGLTKPYAGGEVARGGRVGILGNQDIMSTPFSTTAYTSELIQNQQARSVADVLQNDPTVRIARGFGNFQESYFIRGFIVNSDDISYNGLFGLLPRQYISSELFERVEVFRGASAFLNGATPSGGGIGGSINLLPKRAANEPLSQVTLGVASGSEGYGAVDISRRFGPDQSTGIRLNAAHREGGTGVNDEKTTLDLVSVGLDWRSRNVRLSADVGYQDHRLTAARPNVTLGFGLASVPAAPDNQVNYAQPWTYSNERDTFGSVRGEVDISPNVTAWVAGGARQGVEANSLGNTTVTNAFTGAAQVSRFDNQRREDASTAEVGIRGKFATGSVNHSVVAAYSCYQLKEKNAYAWDYFNNLNSNIYYPTAYPVPPFTSSAFRGNDLTNPALLNKTQLTSFAIGDTMSFLDDRALFTIGARDQKIETTAYAFDTGTPTPSNQSHVSPMAAFVFKLQPQVSLYANYVESLAQGAVAPFNSLNNGSRLEPFVSKQKEVGAKYDGGNFGGTLSYFSTDQPRGVVNNAGYFVESGNNRHQGVELTMFGEPIKGLRVLGGVTLLDAKQHDTGLASTDGKDVIGVPDAQGSLGLDWDVPGVRGLSLNGRVVATGSSYADAANTLKVSSWTRFDIGARYVMDVKGKLLTLRANIENLTNRNYWASVGGYPDNGYLVLGSPRTFSLRASVDF